MLSLHISFNVFFSFLKKLNLIDSHQTSTVYLCLNNLTTSSCSFQVSSFSANLLEIHEIDVISGSFDLNFETCTVTTVT